MIKKEGWASGEKKSALLNWVDVYILPGYNEGLPISILEALGYNCPVISTPVGGIEEVVKDERRMSDSSWVNGRIVSPGNINEIVDAIRFYVEHCDDVMLHGKVSEILYRLIIQRPYSLNYVRFIQAFNKVDLIILILRIE